MSCVLFLGPSAPRQEVEKRLEASILPPAAQGDVHRAVRAGARTIGLLDGAGEGQPSVWHKEILWAMSQGVHVFGASGIGALRAAELHGSGMHGVGKVFEAYRSGALEDDDEVAVVQASAGAGYAALTEPMVNIRASLERAQQDGVVDAETRSALEALGKRIFYQERSWESLLARAEAEEVGMVSIHVLKGWLIDRRVAQKREDALALADAMQVFTEGEPEPMVPELAFVPTRLWEAAVAGAWGAGLPTRSEDGDALDRQRILEELRLQGGAYQAARRRALGRLLALREVDRQGLIPDTEAIEAERNRFRLERGLLSRHALDQWLEESDCDASGFDRLLADEVRIAALEADLEPALGEQILAELRRRGEYAELAARARDKQKRLAAAGQESPKLSDAEMTPTALLAWHYGQQLGEELPERPETLLAAWGLSEMDALYKVILREYLYSRLESAEAEGEDETKSGAPKDPASSPSGD